MNFTKATRWQPWLLFLFFAFQPFQAAQPVGPLQAFLLLLLLLLSLLFLLFLFLLPQPFQAQPFQFWQVFSKLLQQQDSSRLFQSTFACRFFYFYRLLRPFFFWHTLCTHHPTTANGHDARNTFAATTFVAWWTKSKMDSLPRLVLCNLFSLQPFQASAQACLGSAYPLNLFAGCPSWPLSLFSGLLLLLACLSIFRMVCIKFLNFSPIFWYRCFLNRNDL